MDANAGVDLYTALMVAIAQGIEQSLRQALLIGLTLALGSVLILAALLVAANALTCPLYAEGYPERSGRRLWTLLLRDDERHGRTTR